MTDASYPCPNCRRPANLAAGCTGCGSPPDPQAAEVIALNAQIARAEAEAAEAHRRLIAAQLRLHPLRRRRDQLVAAINARRRVPVAPPVVPPVAPPVGVRPRPESAPRTVQSVLFVLGGLLLGSAAVVFTAVAWASVGVTGRAVLQAAVTLLILAVPPVARRRGLRGTAETLAAVGLVLIPLDGYAAWYVNLFGVADLLTATSYAGLVGAVTAAVALGYGWATGLAAPRFVAILAAQPVPVLFAVDRGFGPAGGTVVFALIAIADLALCGGRPARPGNPSDVEPAAAPPPRSTGPLRRRGVRPVLATLGCLAVALAALTGGLAALVSDGLPAATRLAAALMTVAAALAVAGRVAPAGLARAVAAGLAAAVTGVALIRLATALWPGATFLAWAGAVTLLAVAALAVRVLTIRSGPPPAAPQRVRPDHSGGAGPAGAGPGWVRGVWAGAAVHTVLLGLPAIALALLAAAYTATAGLGLLPAEADWNTPLRAEWQLPVVVALLTVIGVVAVPRQRAADVVAGGLALFALALPVAGDAAAWIPSMMDGLVGVPLAIGASLATTRSRANLWAGLAAGLALHAVLAGLDRPATATAVFGGLVAVGAVLAALGLRPAPSTSDSPEPEPRPGAVVGRVAVLVGLLALPAFAASAAELLAADRWLRLGAVGSAPAALAWAVLGFALAVPVAGFIGRRWPGYATPGIAAVSVAGVAVTVGGLVPDDVPHGLVAALAVLGAAGTVRLTRPAPSPADPAGPHPRAAGAGPSPASSAARRWALAGLAPLPVAVVWLVPDLVRLLLAPLMWFGDVWAGAPDGVGLAPDPVPTTGFATSAATLGVLAGASALLGTAVVRPGSARWAAPGTLAARLRPTRWAAVPGGLAALLVLAWAGTPWPGVALGSLAVGSAAVLAAARLPRTQDLLGLAVATGAAGVAGAHATRPVTLVALGTTVVVASTVAVAGRSVGARTTGWVAVALSAGWLAFAAGTAADLAQRWVGLWVVAAAAPVLVLSGALRRLRRGSRIEAAAAEATAHAVAGVALLLTLGSARHAAAVCSVWGVAVGVRALLADTRAGRSARVAAAVGGQFVAYWLVLVAGEVTLIEAYTLPPAAVALGLGWWAARRDPHLHSWVAYGPALLAAFAPSTVGALVGGEPLRRLLVGAAAVAVVLIGARRQAPVVVGAATLVLLAGNEIARAWDLLPRWIPLAVGGLLLIAVAATYERRRRDLARLRQSLARLR